MRVVLEGVHKVKARRRDGAIVVYHYAWRGGPRIKAEPGTEAFVAEYYRLTKPESAPAADTIEALIEHFTGPENARNPDFLALSERTRADHLYAFSLIRKQWPRLPIRLTQMKGMKREIREWHRSMAENPRKADKLLFSLSKVFSYAIQDELVERNPCSGITRLYDGSRRDSIWTQEQIKRFRAKAKGHILAAFELAIHTGQRQGDLLKLKWSDYDGRHLFFVQGKGKTRVRVLVHPRLRLVLESLPRASVFILTNSRGKPWTSDGFKTSWGKACVSAGVEGVTFHDLRGTFITERYREGSTIDEIAAISGHKRSAINRVLDKHYISPDQAKGDAVILRMK